MDELSLRISERAYEIWQQQGEEDGHDVDHWLRAEAEIALKDRKKTPPASQRKVRGK